MKLKMKVTVPGSEDGITVKIYSEGQIYDIRESLATVFLSENLAEEVSEEVVEEKAEEAAPENKMMDYPANKSEKKKR